MITKSVDIVAPTRIQLPVVFISACPGLELTLKLPSIEETVKISGNNHQSEDVSTKSSPTPPSPVPAELSPVFSRPTSPAGYMNIGPNDDFQRINRTIQKLKMCGYYYEGLSWQQASNLLQDKQVGTFLVRDSANPRFLFSVSVQTERGPTSIRIHYSRGQFRLDCPDSLVVRMPLFECVLQLVEYFVRLSQSIKASFCVWLDDSGRRDIRVRLYKPLYKHVLSLQHLCRLTANKRLQARADPALGSWLADDSIDTLEIPKPVKAYLRDYPYPH
ncbi:suppressor of cytokine signaling 2-like isoform X1 [Tachypleus tridentatus]|uniref:suppressor of cytokine signaling 2-like isoform X1 n=1 Tax=Tachypleus tridentatus TaxID=6853 RepID=UPI003FD5343A